jgi:hypothetical protein
VIDLHIIDSGRFPENLARQIERASHPRVNVHIADPVWGSVAEARRRAYALGTAPFVTWADDDDEVLDMRWIDEALRILEDTGVSAVYPRWRSTGALKLETPAEPWALMRSHHYLCPHAHHLTIMRRENVLRFFDEVGDRPLIRDQDLLLVASMARYGRLVALPVMAYRWHLHGASARLHNEPPDLHAWGIAHWRETVLQHRALEVTA